MRPVRTGPDRAVAEVALDYTAAGLVAADIAAASVAEHIAVAEVASVVA